MKNKTKIKKLHTQYSLQWSLKVGDQLGTLNMHKAIQLAKVKPIIFQRWVSGKLAAPVNKLDQIKHHAFAIIRQKHRKKINPTLLIEEDEEIIKARFLWKSMIFDQLGMVAKRKFCTGLRKSNR